MIYDAGNMLSVAWIRFRCSLSAPLSPAKDEFPLASRQSSAVAVATNPKVDAAAAALQ